nr:HAMP domain-containing sensor histidine kinase [Kineosporia rhizophila]
MARYVAPPALLFINARSAVIIAGPDLSQAGATRIAAVTGLVLALTFLITALVAFRLARPLRALVSAAQDTGNLNVRFAVDTTYEIGSLAQALNDLSRRREQAEEQRKEMVSDIAHELRTPLTNIRGWLEAAQDGIASPDAALLSSLQEEAMLLQHIIDDLQTLSSAEAGTLSLSRQQVRASEVLGQVAAAHRATAEAAGVTVLTQVVGEPIVDADPLRLRQVLGNLMSNAIRHTPPGGTVTLSASPDASHTTISVTDTGQGIQPDDLAHVFDRFWRADKSRSRRSGGSGLGLCIVKQLVEAHQGEVEAFSRPGVETVFTLRLPTG